LKLFLLYRQKLSNLIGLNGYTRISRGGIPAPVENHSPFDYDHWTVASRIRPRYLEIFSNHYLDLNFAKMVKKYLTRACSLIIISRRQVKALHWIEKSFYIILRLNASITRFLIINRLKWFKVFRKTKHLSMSKDCYRITSIWYLL